MNAVKITLWGKTVGCIYWDKKSKRALFQYEDAYVQTGWDLAPLTKQALSTFAAEAHKVGVPEEIVRMVKTEIVL